MASIDEALAAEGGEIISPLKTPELATDYPTSGGVGIDLSFLTTETGDGSIADYQTHPLNPNGSKGLAQIIRGLTGLVGNNLRLAIADIIFGLLNYMKERRTPVANITD